MALVVAQELAALEPEHSLKEAAEEADDRQEFQHRMHSKHR